MASSDNLLSQLADRTASFIRHSGITQSRLCQHLGVSDSSLSQFLSGKAGLGPPTLIKLCQVLSLSHREIEAKFAQPAKSAKILNLQESTLGQPAQTRLDANDGAWVPGQSGVDPADSTDITDTSSADTTGPAWDQKFIDSLREVRGIYRQAARAVNAYINKAKVNAGIVTPTGVSQKFSRR